MTGRGLSLIETLLYLALLSILMTGGLAGAHAISATAERTREQARIEQEGVFLLERLRWSLQWNLHTPDLSTLSTYPVKRQTIIHAGTQEDPSDPEYILISFTLSTQTGSAPAERLFQYIFYPAAP